MTSINQRKAAYLIQYGAGKDAFKLKLEPIPAINNKEILVKVQTSGINFADVMARRGLYKPAPKPPSILGYDLCGHILSVGKEVKQFKVGDRITALSIFGGYASHVVVNELNAIKINESIPSHHACSLMTQGITAYYGACQSISVLKGERVLVHAAAGGVGSIMVQLLKNKGAIVIGTASKHKHPILKSLGVDYMIDSRADDFDVQVNKIFPDGIDYVFDNIGGKAFKRAQNLLRFGGRIVAFGAASQNIGNRSGIIQSIKVALGFGFYNPIRYIQKSQSLIGLNLLSLGESRPELIQLMASSVYKLYQKGEITLLEGKVFSSESVGEAHEYIESRQSIGKIAISW